jgi:hypothetical protein
MAYKSAARRSSKTHAPADLTETVLTIPDALLAWALEPGRQVHWSFPFGQEVATMVEDARDTPLRPEDTERLLSRLDGLVSAAVKEGRQDLLVGFDFQTAEWLGLNFHVETERGPMHIGPDPRTRPFEGSPQPQWTYSEVRAVVDHRSREAASVAWAAKALLAEAFPESRISVMTLDAPEVLCVACGKPSSSVMMATDAGEYHGRCWSALTAPLPEHLRELLRKSPKASTR